MTKRSIDKIVVIGGGTAGWLTALYAQAVMPNKRITVIESDKIGILGAGEGTTPDIIRIFDAIGIPVSQLIKETSCVIKNGVRFINWNGGGDKDAFFHSFHLYGDLKPSYYKVDELICSTPYQFTAPIFKNKSFEDLDFFSKLCEENRLPFYKDETQPLLGDDPIFKYQNVGAFAVHFDASKLAKFLKKIAMERGIRHIEGIVKEYAQDVDGDVRSLLLDSGKTISCDFVFDCSGFASFFNKKFGSEWISYAKHLPTDSAVPFFIPINKEEEIPPYTQAIAMKYGWMWKTALQDRYGCGYVFDSSLITQEQAIEEIEEYLGFEPYFPRKEAFKFNAGYYDTPWQHNVISIGLASGFIEPLEATSLWVATTSLGRVLSAPELLHSRDIRIVNDFNDFFKGMNEEILNFIYWHFYTDREDTEFWKKFTKENAPKGLKKIIDLLESRLPQYDDFADSIWPISSWMKVGLGHNNKYIKENAEEHNDHHQTTLYFQKVYTEYNEKQKHILPKFVTHREFLEDLAGGELRTDWTYDGRYTR